MRSAIAVCLLFFRKEYMYYRVLMDMFSNCLQLRKYRSKLVSKNWEMKT